MPPKSEKTIEERYQKKTQLEHILLRPDTYIGSIEPATNTLWLYNEEKNRMEERTVTYVPGLYKIFDEILVNAADNKQRDPDMDCIKVDINAETNEISVWNNGQGIPVEIHKEHQVYVPELVFGHLLTGSNFDDDEKKVVGGRNGYGAKLTNIFSTEFTIETVDSNVKKKYKQTFRNNMSIREEPKITSASNTASYTKVTFKPDLKKFNMTSLDKDTIDVLTKRVYDVAGCNSSVKVLLNGNRLKIKSFKDYCKLYTIRDTGNELPLIYEKCNDRWEIAFTLSDGSFQQVSFVNSISTFKGGKHVTHVADQIAKPLLETAMKKAKNTTLKPANIKNQMFVFVNCLIENPAFDSQTKENMTTVASKFGSKCEISDDFHKKVSKSGILDNIIAWARFKESRDLKKTSGKKKARLTGIAKLDDANNAGKRSKSEDCTLILTEGDSAKTLAVAGLSVIGRDNFGVFPLKGKLLNVRDATHSQIMKNEELKTLTQILGLEHQKKYENLKDLRYGHVMIMTDQDHDGSHIKGLLINWIHHFWPSLLKIDGFLQEFITPIVKATKGRQTISFFTIPEYENWKKANNNGKGWTIKYYKGLGTSTAEEAKAYFANFSKHQINFKWEDKADERIDLAFNKKKADERKQWLSEFEEGTFVDHSKKSLTYSDFIDKELILFSREDTQRSIPSLVDGLKPGQRKILYSCFKRNLKKEIKVAQLTGYVAEHSAYHHGEMSLSATIIGMAQNFVGSNNINFLEPRGQFGTRLQGGKDSASPRYIFTTLAPITRALFNVHDDKLLKYLDDDGQQIEPEWYIPIIPTILVNGSAGIGTGYSSNIPNYDPREIIENMKAMIRGEEPSDMVPWYRGFTGTITVKDASKGNYETRGIIEKIDDNTVKITELPIKMWTQTYKEFLEELENPENGEPLIEEFREYHTDVTVDFEVSMTAEQMANAEKEGLYKFFKLTSSISTSNMTLFDAQGRIKKYPNVVSIMKEFYDVRLEYYQKRKNYLVGALELEFDKLDNKVRFIKAVISGDIVVSKRKKKDLEEELFKKGYKQFPKENTKKPKVAGDDQEEQDEEEDTEEDDNARIKKGAYDYLLSMPLLSLTTEKVAELEKQRADKEEELSLLLKKDIKDIWLEDLDKLLEAYEQCEEADAKALENTIAKAKKGKGRTTKKPAAKRAPAKKKKVDDEDEDDEFEGLPKKSTASKKATATKKEEDVKMEDAAPTKTTTKAATTTGKRKLGPKTQTLDAWLSPKKKDEPKTEEEEKAKVEEEEPKKETITKKAPSKPRPKKVKDEEEEFDFDMDDDEEEEEELIEKPTRPKRAAARTTKSKPKKYDDPDDFAFINDDTEEEGGDDDDDGSDWEASVKKTDDDDGDDDDNAKKKKKPALKKTTAAATKKAPAKKVTRKQKEEDEDEEGKDEEEEDKPAPVKRARTTTTTTKKTTTAAAASKEEEEEGPIVLDDDEEEDELIQDTKKKPPASTKKTTKSSTAAAAAKKKKVVDDDDDDDELEEKAAAAAAPTTRLTRTTTRKINYAESEGDDDDSDVSEFEIDE